MKLLFAVIGTLAAGLLLAAGLAFSGAISFAADEPHWQWIFHAIETARERSIVSRARGIEVPDLDDPALLASGAEHYAAMCTGCHLAPGMEETEMRAGLYPQPPIFANAGHDESHADEPIHVHAHGDAQQTAARQFWIVKHGLKGSGMPAWGVTHDDRSVWGLVAFVQKLPKMPEDEYRRLTAGGEGRDGQHHQHGAQQAGESQASPPHQHGVAEGVHEHGHADAATPGNGSGEAGRQEHAGHKMASSSETAESAEAAVDAFSKALATGNTREVLRRLAPDVLIYESGHQETSRDEYAAAHMKGDMDFLGRARIERLERRSNGSPYIAWVTSRVRIRAESKGKPVDAVSTETMVLTREDDGWRIRHIHWSSGES